MTGYETAILTLEQLVKKLVRQVNDLAAKVNRALDSINPPFPTLGGGNTPQISWGYTTSAIPARSGNIVTTGTVKLTYGVAPTNPTSPPSYTITDQGYPDVNATNVTGGVIPVNTGVIVYKIGGIYTAIVADCSTVAAPAPAPGNANTTTQNNQDVTTQDGQTVTTQ